MGRTRAATATAADDDDEDKKRKISPEMISLMVCNEKIHFIQQTENQKKTL